MPLLDLRIDDALQETWADFTAYMVTRFDKEIRGVKWDWPREPSPRDIIDTDNLRRSIRLSSTAGRRLSIEFRWEAPYAPYVHDGAVYKSTDADGNPRTLTARPWTRPVLRDGSTLRRYFAMRFRLAMQRRASQ